MFFFISAWTNGWVINGDVVDWRRNSANYDNTLMPIMGFIIRWPFYQRNHVPESHELLRKLVLSYCGRSYQCKQDRGCPVLVPSENSFFHHTVDIIFSVSKFQTLLSYQQRKYLLTLRALYIQCKQASVSLSPTHCRFHHTVGKSQNFLSCTNTFHHTVGAVSNVSKIHLFYGPIISSITLWALFSIQWNLSVTTTSIIKFITSDLFSNVF